MTVKLTHGKTSKTYKLTIKRTKSTNAKLSKLTSSVRAAALTPGFAAGTTTYTVTLPAKTSPVTLSWKTADTLAKATIAGKARRTRRLVRLS